jgi:membrane protease YdiL (CAAX protease family)
MPDSNEDLTQLAYQMYLQSGSGRAAEQAKLKRKAAAANKPLRWAAIWHTALAVIVFALLQGEISIGNPQALQTEILLGFLAAAFWGLWWWSLESPLPAAILGLLLLVTMFEVVAMSSDPTKHAPSSRMPTMGFVTLGLLIKAVMDGSRQRRLEKVQKAAADGQTINLPGSIASGMWLFVVLLAIVLIPVSLTVQGEWEFGDLVKVERFFAIVTVTWAIIAWRDTLPAVTKTPDGKWYGAAIGGALGLVVLATAFLVFLNHALGIQIIHPESTFLQEGYGWMVVIAATAAFPAVFEELAFRGVIVPCLHRALSEWETIVVTAIMFMMMHLSVYAVPQLCLGIAVAYIRLRSGSLWPCVLMHFTYNVSCLAMGHYST